MQPFMTWLLSLFPALFSVLYSSHIKHPNPLFHSLNFSYLSNKLLLIIQDPTQAPLLPSQDLFPMPTMLELSCAPSRTLGHVHTAFLIPVCYHSLVILKHES